MDDADREKTLRTLVDLAESSATTDCWDEGRAEDLLRSQSSAGELRALGASERTIEQIFKMRKLPNHTALKEWSTVIDALGAGRQVILLRKGGIADPAFGVEAPQFYLYPTYFHQGESEARPHVTITHWCEVVRVWSVRDAEALRRLQPFVALPEEALESRYRFRSDQALIIIGVRTWMLPRAATVIFRDQYAGCRSWLSLDEEIDVEGSRLSLEESELQLRLAAIDALLAVPV